MKSFRRVDIWIIASILLVSGLVYFLYQTMNKDTRSVAEIYVGDTLVRRVVLEPQSQSQSQSQSQTVITVPTREQVELTVDAQRGIAFTHSDCPDQVCVHAGWLRIPGQSAACLPNQVIVRIAPLSGEPDDDMLTK